jgi:hypothetical protein
MLAKILVRSAQSPRNSNGKRIIVEVLGGKLKASGSHKEAKSVYIHVD